MTLSLVFTLASRPASVIQQVADSFRLPGNAPDEAVIVLDRSPKETRDAAHAAWDSMPFPVRFVSIPGEPSWLCPARAWNMGFAIATSDLLYLISSEVVQDPGNMDKARELASGMNLAVFGACHNSVPEQLVEGAEPGLLVSSSLARPLGFIECLPAKNMKAVGGMDDAFMSGYWYDDDDLHLRLWQSGLDFLFTDAIHGIHLHHERPVLATPEGQAGIQRNQATMLKKHGLLHPWGNLPRVEDKAKGETRWSHL